MPSLEERVQGLAAELSIRIKEFTFTLEEDEIEITEDYKPPFHLHVDRASREHALSTIKYLVNGRYEEAGIKWLKSLGTNEANIPKNIRYEVENHLWNRPDGYSYGFGMMSKVLPLKDRVVLIRLIPKQDRARLYWVSTGGALRRLLVPPTARPLARFKQRAERTLRAGHEEAFEFVQGYRRLAEERDHDTTCTCPATAYVDQTGLK